MVRGLKNVLLEQYLNIMHVNIDNHLLRWHYYHYEYY